MLNDKTKEPEKERERRERRRKEKERKNINIRMMWFFAIANLYVNRFCHHSSAAIEKKKDIVLRWGIFTYKSTSLE